MTRAAARAAVLAAGVACMAGGALALAGVWAPPGWAAALTWVVLGAVAAGAALCQDGPGSEPPPG